MSTRRAVLAFFKAFLSRNMSSVKCLSACAVAPRYGMLLWVHPNVCSHSPACHRDSPPFGAFSGFLRALAASGRPVGRCYEGESGGRLPAA